MLGHWLGLPQEGCDLGQGGSPKLRQTPQELLAGNCLLTAAVSKSFPEGGSWQHISMSVTYAIVQEFPPCETASGKALQALFLMSRVIALESVVIKSSCDGWNSSEQLGSPFFPKCLSRCISSMRNSEKKGA